MSQYQYIVAYVTTKLFPREQLIKHVERKAHQLDNTISVTEYSHGTSILNANHKQAVITLESDVPIRNVPDKHFDYQNTSGYFSPIAE